MSIEHIIDTMKEHSIDVYEMNILELPTGNRIYCMTMKDNNYEPLVHRSLETKTYKGTSITYKQYED